MLSTFYNHDLFYPLASSGKLDMCNVSFLAVVQGASHWFFLLSVYGYMNAKLHVYVLLLTC